MPTIVGTTGDDTLEGTTGPDLIQGLEGNDLLIGHGGGDQLQGDAGNDVIVVFEAADEAIEAVGAGFDTVYTYGDYQLSGGSEIERLSAVDWRFTTPLQLIGNEFANLIEGNAGDNFLDGGAGADTMVGFGGDDIYLVDNSNDVVVEYGDAGSEIGRRRYGIDTVYTTVDYTLGTGSFVEILSIFDRNSTAPLQLVGNELDNVIEGNAGANFLRGAGGADSLFGFDGDDVYVVTSSNSRVIEFAGNGYDTVYAYTDFTLAPGSAVERLSAYDWTRTENLNLGGNELSNLIEGNAGNNRLSDGGGSGIDTLIGFGGNDFYLIDNSATIIVEAALNEYDSVQTSVNYTLTPGAEIEQVVYSGLGGGHLVGNEFGQLLQGGTTGGNVLEGGGGADTLRTFSGSDTLLGGDGNDDLQDIGNDGTADYLDGGLGADKMSGGSGGDTFAFTTALGGGNVDHIVDFGNGSGDRIALDDAIFSALSVGALPASAFVSGTAATTADQHIIYDNAHGHALLYDPDGNGPMAAVQFATIDTGFPLTAANFVVI
jgi:Ca2+-binding RTX toxin-like protein